MARTVEQLVERLRSWLPTSYEQAEPLLAAFAGAMRGAELALDELEPLVSIDGGEGQWLTLQARGQNCDRSEGESDASLRERMRTVEDAVSRPALEAATQAVLDENGVVGSVVVLEWWEGPYVDVDETVLPGGGGFYVGWARMMSGPRCFLVLVPVSTGDTVKAAIIDEIQRLRAAGVGWKLVWGGP